MKCPHCGEEVAENLVICQSCGARLVPEDEAESQAIGSGGGGQATGGAATATPRAAAAPAAGGSAGSAGPGAADEFPPPWSYSLKDMRVAWGNMLALTIALLLLGVVVEVKGWLPWLPSLILWGVLLGVPAVCWIYQLSKAIYRTTIKYDLDESRLIHKEGIFVSKTNVVELIRISDMSATQTLSEKYCCGGIGKVRIHSDDPSTPDLILRGLENHESVFRQIDHRRAEARRKKAFIQA